MIETLKEFSDNILLVAFLLILFATFIYILSKSLKKWFFVKKEKWTQKKACEEAKWLDKKLRYTDYFWANPWLFIVISLGFFMLYTLSLFLYESTKVVLFLLIFVLYIAFVKYAIKWYINFPKVAKEKLEEHENAITENVCKETTEHSRKINEFLSSYSLPSIDYSNIDFDCKDNVIKHPTAIEKFDYPPFINLDGPKKSVIKSRQLQFFILERDFMIACLSPAKFDLLYPERLDEKKKCALKRGAGKCFDIFYSEIKQVTYEDGGIKIYYWDNLCKEPIIMKVGKEEDAKPDIFKIRQQIRLLERQRLNKIAEILQFERLKDKNLRVEVVNDDAHKIEVINPNNQPPEQKES